jgi:hypothetical protein
LLPLLAAAGIAWNSGQVAGQGRRLSLAGRIVGAQEAGAGFLEILSTAMAGRARIRKNLRRRLAGIKILGASGGRCKAYEQAQDT